MKIEVFHLACQAVDKVVELLRCKRAVRPFCLGAEPATEVAYVGYLKITAGYHRNHNLLGKRGYSVQQATHVQQFCLGRTEIECQVEQDWKVVLVFGHMEIDYLFLLAVVFGYQRDNVAVVGHVVVGLRTLPVAVDKMLVLYALACSNGESEPRTLVKGCEIECARIGKQAHHVVDRALQRIGNALYRFVAIEETL